MNGGEGAKMADYMKWWREARFGLFVHWGLYSELGGVWRGQRMDYIGEWTQSRFRIPNSELEKVAASFDPVRFDADAWAAMAKRAGMGYIMVTAKHHEGFAMYHSKCDRYNIIDATPFGRDPIKELSEACAKHGIRLCLYYSQALDWHEPDAGGTEPGLPSNFGMSWGNDWDFPDHASKRFERYFERKAIPQVTELLTGYGPIGALFFDCPFTISYEQCRRLENLVKSIQPGCLTNTRLGGGFGDIKTLGDNQVPGCRMGEGYECISTINDTWGYKIHDHNWKTRDQLLELLTACCANDVNYLLNIGPKADGRFPEPAVAVLEQMGEWMAINCESIHGTQPSPFPAALPSGPVTSRGGTLYLHMQNRLESPLRVYGIKNAVKSVECLGKDINPAFETGRIAPLDIPCLTIRFDPQKLSRFDVIKVVLDAADGIDIADIVGSLVQASDNTLALPASRAEILQTGEAREKAPSLSWGGVITGWFDTGYALKWRFMLNTPGRYRAYVTTGTVNHSQPWAGGHRVRLRTSEGVSGEAVLCGDIPSEAVGDLYYPKASSYAGEIAFSSAGEHWLALEGTEILDNGGTGLAVCDIRLEPSGE